MCVINLKFFKKFDKMLDIIVHWRSSSKCERNELNIARCISYKERWMVKSCHPTTWTRWLKLILFFQVKISVCLSSEYLIAKCKIVLAKLVNKQVVFAVTVAFVVRLKTLSYFRRNARDQNSDLLKSWWQSARVFARSTCKREQRENFRSDNSQW